MSSKISPLFLIKDCKSSLEFFGTSLNRKKLKSFFLMLREALEKDLGDELGQELMDVFLEVKKDLEKQSSSLFKEFGKEGILRGEFIGRELSIKESNSTFKGKKGIVVWETKNTFKILTLHKKKGKKFVLVDLPKQGNLWELSLKGEEKLSLCFEGDSIIYNPVERSKRIRGDSYAKSKGC